MKIMAKKTVKEKKEEKAAAATNRQILEAIYHKVAYIESVVKVDGDKIQRDNIKEQLFAQWVKEQQEKAAKDAEKEAAEDSIDDK